MADKAETPTPPAAEKASAGGSKLPVIIGGLNAALTAGVLALLVLRGGAAATPAPDHHAPEAAAAGEHAEAAPAAAGEGGHGEKGEKGEAAAAGPRPGPVLNLPDFVVHLRDPDADRYARLTFDIEVKDDAGKEALGAHLPQVRDAFLAYLSDRSVEELRGSEGIALVKGDLTKKLSEIAPGVPVKALYVTELVVQ